MSGERLVWTRWFWGTGGVCTGAPRFSRGHVWASCPPPSTPPNTFACRHLGSWRPRRAAGCCACRRICRAAGAAAGGRGARGRTRRGGLPRLHPALGRHCSCRSVGVHGVLHILSSWWCAFVLWGRAAGLLCPVRARDIARARAACTYARHACAPADLPAHLSLGSFARRSPPGQKEWW